MPESTAWPGLLGPRDGGAGRGVTALSPVLGRDHEERPLTPVQLQLQEKPLDITILQTHQEPSPSFMLPYPKGLHFKRNLHLSSHNKYLLTLFFLKKKSAANFPLDCNLNGRQLCNGNLLKVCKVLDHKNSLPCLTQPPDGEGYANTLPHPQPQL